MARALLGHVGPSHENLLAYEVARLRRRVAELEAELDSVRARSEETLELELHRLAETAEPALA